MASMTVFAGPKRYLYSSGRPAGMIVKHILASDVSVVSDAWVIVVMLMRFEFFYSEYR